MNIGITGSRGFLGQHVSHFFEDQSYRVYRLDQNSSELKLDCIPDKLELDWIFHFAARAKIKESFSNSFQTYQNNIQATLNALEISKQSGAKFFYQSSYVYGTPQYQPIDEEHPCKPTNPYMSSKLIGEQLTRDFCILENIPFTIFRAFNIYGSHLPAGRLIGDLLVSAQKQTNFELNHPDPKRDYLHIDDYTKLLLKLTQTSPVPSGPFNVGYGKTLSNLEAAECLNSLLKNKINIDTLHHPRQGDIMECQANISKVCKQFNWKPEISLKEGFRKCLAELGC